MAQAVARLAFRCRDRRDLLAGLCDALVGSCGAVSAWALATGEDGRALAVAGATSGRSLSPGLARLEAGELPACARACLASTGVNFERDGDLGCDGCVLRGSCRPGCAVAASFRVDGALLGHFGATLTPELLADEGGRDAIADAVAAVSFALEAMRREDGRRRLEEELRHAQKMEALGRLAGSLAHDVNNVLTGIGGYCELILSGLAEGAPVDADVREIRTAVRRAGDLTRQLLSFARRQAAEAEILSPDDIGATSRPLIGRLLGEDVVLDWRVAPGAGCVRVDRGQMDQVLVNLAVNARDAMPDGGTLRVHLEPWVVDAGSRRAGLEPGPYLRITVADDGCGMDAETLRLAFDPYFTTKAPGEGTGLGLSTVQAIVRAAGGEVEAASLPGRGTTFTVLLPCVEGAVEPALCRDSTVTEVGDETILLVEDDLLVRQVTRLTLERLGYRIIEAEGAATAQRAFGARASEIDLLLTDVVMPGLTGPALFERLRSLRPGLRVLYVSGYSEDVMVRKGLPSADASFLQKPFTPSSLARAVRLALA